MLRMQEANAKNQKAAKSHKAKKGSGTGNAEDAKRETVNAEDAK